MKKFEFFIKRIKGEGMRISLKFQDMEVGRAYLYILRNDLHDRPFGLMEDVFIDPYFRGRGLGTLLVKEVLNQARIAGCYKLIATSRYGRENVHRLYKDIGFKDWGVEFRYDF
jgi:GNAT superfamily N-acetyltransferase